MVEAVSKWQKQAIEAVPFPSHIRIRILGYTNQSAGKHGTRVVICLAVAVPICADVDLARITLQPLQPLGFGSFGVKERAARTGINPHTGVLSRVMRKNNSVTYEVGSAKAEQAAGMFGLTADQRSDSCPSRVAKPLAKPLTGGWRSATYARSQQSAPCFSRSICSSDFMLM